MRGLFIKELNNVRYFNKGIIVISLLYVIVMLLGIYQDWKIFEVEKKSSLIIADTEAEASNEEILNRLTEMSDRENLCMYTYRIDKDNNKIYYLLSKSSTEAKKFAKLIENHNKMDLDNINKVQLYSGDFPIDKLTQLNVLGKDVMDESLLDEFGLSYFISEVHYDDGFLLIIFQKYGVLLLLFFLVTSVFVYLEAIRLRKKIYYKNLFGLSFRGIAKQILVENFLVEFGIMTIGASILLCVLFKVPIQSVCIGSLILLAFLLINYLICLAFLYRKYRKMIYINNLNSKKLISWVALGTYTATLVVMLLNISPLVNYISTNNSIIEASTINENTYKMLDITFGLSEKKTVELTGKLNENKNALFIREYPLFQSKSNGDVIQDTTYPVFLVNKNYIKYYKLDNLLSENDQVSILVPEKYTEQSNIIEQKLASTGFSGKFIIYRGDVLFNTFSEDHTNMDNIILVYDKAQIISNNDFYFLGESKMYWKDKLDEIYNGIGIDNNTEVFSYQETKGYLVQEIKNELTNYMILLGAYLFATIYLMVFLVNQFFDSNSKNIILKSFYGSSILKASKKLFITLLICQSLGTLIALVFGSYYWEIILAYSLCIYIAQFLLSVIILNNLVHKNISAFLKGVK